jgi:hypothetical protein
MTQLIFVHGVATRPGTGYTTAVANRDRLIRDILFEGAQVTIHSPVWGDLVPAIDETVFATAGQVKSFNLGSGLAGIGSSAADGGGQGDFSVAAIAQKNSTAALDAIFTALLEKADAEDRLLTDREMAAFRNATGQVAAGKSTIESQQTDDGLVFELEKGLPKGSFGLQSTIRDAVSAVADRMRNTVSTVAFGTVRDYLSPAIAFFLGDVFVYLKQGDLRDQIRKRVTDTIAKAHAEAKAKNEPLVIIGHSLGGVILYDLLSAPGPELPPDLKVNALITVGSQPGLFQAIGVFDRQAPAHERAPRPDSVQAWYNVFDPIDPLAFRADHVFSGVEDMSFDSITGLASAHTTYFKRPQFHARCRKRLQELKVI